MENKSCGCNGGCCEPAKKLVKIELLYLDLNTCDRCQGTEAALEAAVAEITPALQSAGFRVEVSKVLIETRDIAVQYRLRSSPTIRVNGRDIAPQLKETPCASCGDICGTDVDCRAWEYEGQDYASPPKALIAEAILRAAFSCVKAEETPYALPENLERFFASKSAQPSV
jgi:hypothetical protein